MSRSGAGSTRKNMPYYIHIWALHTTRIPPSATMVYFIYFFLAKIHHATHKRQRKPAGQKPWRHWFSTFAVTHIEDSTAQNRRNTNENLKTKWHKKDLSEQKNIDKILRSEFKTWRYPIPLERKTTKRMRKNGMGHINHQHKCRQTRIITCYLWKRKKKFRTKPVIYYPFEIKSRSNYIEIRNT